MAQLWVIDDAGQGRQADVALADAGVAVLGAADGVPAVVEMNGPQSLKADDPVEFGQHAVEVVDDIVAGVMHVTGVKTDTHFFPQGDPVQNQAQFLKVAAKFTALAGHGLQQHRRRLLRRQDGVELGGDQGDARLFALSDMTAWMEGIEIARQVFQAFQVVLHGVQCEMARLGVGRAGVERVGGMGQDAGKAVPGGQVEEGREVGLIELFGRAPAGIAREKLQGVGTDSKRGLAHGQKAFADREMTTDVQHECSACG